MEITFSKSRPIQIAALILVIAAAIFAYQTISAGKLFALFAHATPEISVEEYNNQPAMKALATIYAPSSDQAAWEQSACLNMTRNGCNLFKTYYAPAIWKSGVNGTDTGFVKVKATLEDGSQVWLANTTLNGNIQPLFIQVEKRADGQWVLARILFEEEATKYEN